MSKLKKYILNPETLLYEIKEDKNHTFLKTAGVISASVALLVALLLGHTYVLGFDLPKTMLLKQRNAEWAAKVELLNARLDEEEAVLDGLEKRDNGIYRSIFGMNEIPSGIREAGLGGGRFGRLASMPRHSALRRTAMRLDRLTKKAYIQSKSFDDVAAMAGQAGSMALCIPAIIPVRPDARKFRFTSAFGYRRDPFSQQSRFHAGDDFSCDTGTPVHATADGVVEQVRNEFSGYGLSVLVNHGFGYQTRYAHLSRIDVTDGQPVRRGAQLGLSGNTGRSTGPHVHYEVIYRGKPVDPGDYFDVGIPADEYQTLVRNASGGARR